MPLRQSTLSFGSRSPSNSLSVTRKRTSASRPSNLASSATIEADTDTIVVDTSSGSNEQLPTPAESATDASSQDGSIDAVNKMSKARPKRVTSRHTNTYSSGLDAGLVLLELDAMQENSHRTVTKPSKARSHCVSSKRTNARDPDIGADLAVLEFDAMLDEEMAAASKRSEVRSEHATSTYTNSDDADYDSDLAFLELDLSVEEKHGRSISGETLVNSANHTNAPRNDSKSTSLSCSSHNVSADGKKAESRGYDMDREIEIDSQNTVILSLADQDGEKEIAEREQKAAARKAKLEENARKWEERKKAAETNATRKSGRNSVLGKASQIVTEVSSVLGKRSREIVEKGLETLNDLKSNVRSVTKEPASKKARTADPEHISQPPAPKKSSTRREKKWLVSGLYAGQVRTFDARLTETGNKRKSTPKQEQSAENSVLPLPMFAGERLLKQGRDFKLPFDVFAPPPPGQAKPDGWKKCNKNVFVGDAADVWRANKLVEQSTCYCQPEIGCDQDCINRYMYYECDSNNCRLTHAECGNRQWEDLRRRVKIQTSYSTGVDVVKTADRGFGVRSNRTFEPNQLIVEYAGEIITQEECEHRMRTIYKDNECYYLMLFDQNMILDATRGSVARFVNHSCEPNCRMEKWTVDGKPRMALFAGEAGIMTGEELTYDYNFDPYSQKNVQVCRCGATKCRGILGPKPKEVKQKSPDADGISKKPEGRIAGAKRKLAEAIEESSTRVQKKSKIGGPSKIVKRAPPKASSPRSKQSKKVVAVKKVTGRKVSMPKTTTKQPSKSQSKMKKVVAGVKGRAALSKAKRSVSAGSAVDILLKSPKQKSPATKKKAGLSRSSSLKQKATLLKETVKKTMRGSRRRGSTIEVQD